MKLFKGILILSSTLTVLASYATAEWETVDTIGEPVARHEAAFIEFEGKFYLLGGRGIRPVSIYSPITNTWRKGTPPPLEVHHFQPVVYGDRILMIGAFTGKYPGETPIERVIAYVPASDTWVWGTEIPAERRRGAAGATVVDGKIHIVGGIVNGHIGGYVNWFDVFDPDTNTWTQLPDAPHRRDHFQSVYLNGKLYAAGGRRSSQGTGDNFQLVVPKVDVFDFASGSWSSLAAPLPTPRAGSFTMILKDSVVVLGGESGAQKKAHNEVEAYDTKTDVWRRLPDLQQGRHGTGAFRFDSHIYTCSGCGNRGGSPELTSMERFKIP